MQGVRIRTEETSSDWVEKRLLEDLRTTAPQGVNVGFALVAAGSGKDRLGGLQAATSYGWLLIKILWVDPAHRRAGIGRMLVEQALERARGLGCHAAWLDTSNHQAMRFYETLGFQTFGRLENGPDCNPPNHVRWFMQRAL